MDIFPRLLKLDNTSQNQITPDDKLTVLCEITIDGKDIQQSGKIQVKGAQKKKFFTYINVFFFYFWDYRFKEIILKK